MKQLLVLIALLFANLAGAATLNSVGLLNPAGSTAGQTIVSTGASSAPAWATVPLSGLSSIAANTVLANVTASSAAPAAVALPSCSTANSALKYTSGTGLSCGTTFALTSGNLSQFAATTSAQLAGVISDETGSGPLVFSASPTFTGTVSAAAITATGLITPSSTVGIKGTATNDSAQAGSVGEVLSNSTTGTSLTAGTAANATSVSLTAGDWDVECVVQFNPAAGTIPARVQSGVSTTSANISLPLGQKTLLQLTFGTAAQQIIASPVTRISLSATTTTYCVAEATFTVSTMTADGFIRARRVR